MAFQAPKHYRTRGGDLARVYATDGAFPCPIHGAIQASNGSWSSETWAADGTFDPKGSGRSFMDLIDPAAVPEPTEACVVEREVELAGMGVR